MTSLLGKLTEITATSEKVTKDILLLKFTIVNLCLVKNLCTDNDWVLIDAGLTNSSKSILEAAEDWIGNNIPPKAIILTHGHFDHVGSIKELSNHWKAPIYAHNLELPYLTGQKDYPSADPTVDGGLIAEMSPLFPNEAINLEDRVQALPEDGSIPGIPGWKWIHTPGHTPGHISLFRENDRVLMVGDAFTTVKQESALSVLTQREKIGGPPAYFTTDWKAAEESVKRLAALKPSIAIPSHGQPMKGADLSRHLEMLTHNFDSIAIPAHGRFVE